MSNEYKDWLKDDTFDKLQIEYVRTYNNLDKCLEAFEKIVIICKAQQNYEVAKIVEECLNSLERK